MRLKPIFKWSGGKTKELPVVDKYKPEEFDTYYEPFIGGGAVWLSLNNKKNVVGDNFVELINFYNTLKKYKREAIDYINNVVDEYNSIDKEKITKDEFYKVSDQFYYQYRDNDFDNDLDNTLKFYLLRQLSFSGMLRFSRNGKFNVPFGWYKKLKRLEYDQRIYDILDNTQFNLSTWDKTLSKSTRDDFVFLDPPYTRKFQQYSPYGSFGEDDHIKLSEWFKSEKSNVMIILNKDDFTHSLYNDYIVDEYDKRYSIQYRDRMTTEDSNTIHFIALNYKPSQP